MLMVLKQAKTFFIIEHNKEQPLRGAICDIWEPRKLSPRFTDLWHSKSEDRREAVVLLESVCILRRG
jgi:hypothetical protein